MLILINILFLGYGIRLNTRGNFLSCDGIGFGKIVIIFGTDVSSSVAYNSKGQIKCVSLNNRPCQARPTILNINSKEPLYSPFIVSVNKSGKTC